MKKIIYFIIVLICLLLITSAVLGNQIDTSGNLDTFHFFDFSSPNNRLVSRTRLIYQLWYPKNNKTSYTFAIKALNDDLNNENNDIEARE